MIYSSALGKFLFAPLKCFSRLLMIQEDWYDKGRIDVSEYDAFELRVRSDGRRFIANITAPTLGRKDDVWQCFVYTRGGPEWENIRVSQL